MTVNFSDLDLPRLSYTLGEAVYHEGFCYLRYACTDGEFDHEFFTNREGKGRWSSPGSIELGTCQFQVPKSEGGIRTLLRKEWAEEYGTASSRFYHREREAQYGSEAVKSREKEAEKREAEKPKAKKPSLSLGGKPAAPGSKPGSKPSGPKM